MEMESALEVFVFTDSFLLNSFFETIGSFQPAESLYQLCYSAINHIQYLIDRSSRVDTV